MLAKHGRLTGGGVLDEEADHVAERGAPLGDTGEPPQQGFLHHLSTWEAVERKVVFLLEELLGPRSKACRGRERNSGCSGGSPQHRHRPPWHGWKPGQGGLLPSLCSSWHPLLSQMRKHCLTVPG